jgi:hypothetical protein
MIDGGLFQDATQLKLNVLFALHFHLETTPTAGKNCFVKCVFSIDHVSTIEDNAVKLTEDEGDDWYSLQGHGMQFEDCAMCGSALKVMESRVLTSWISF